MIISSKHSFFYIHFFQTSSQVVNASTSRCALLSPDHTSICSRNWRSQLVIGYRPRPLPYPSPQSVLIDWTPQLSILERRLALSRSFSTAHRSETPWDYRRSCSSQEEWIRYRTEIDRLQPAYRHRLHEENCRVHFARRQTRWSGFWDQRESQFSFEVSDLFA